jgi:hypothetical protein
MRCGEGHAAEAWSIVEGALLDDVNTPMAIAALSEPLKSLNELLTVKKKKKARNPSLPRAARVVLSAQ